MMLSYILVLFVLFLQASYCFIPDNLLGTASPSSTFHTDMTEAGLIAVARDFFNSQRKPGGAKIRGNTAKDIFNDYFGDEVDSEDFEETIEKLKRATASVDKDQGTKDNPDWHFDAERIYEAHFKLQRKFKTIVALLRRESYDSARDLMGKMLHPLQDFYSHTNWYELGYKEPNYNVGIPGKFLGIRIAGETEPTCRDCSKDFSSRFKSAVLKLSLAGFAVGALGGDEDNIYDCQDNLVIQDKLTSGYYSKQEDEDGNKITKPKGIGKCSHGGALDGTSSTHATGGLNKDSNSALFSSHDYFHEKAVPYAIRATQYWVNQIRAELNDDKKFARFLHLLPGASMAFVIDVSPSMNEHVEAVHKEVDNILKGYRNRGTQLVRFMLVPMSCTRAGPVLVSDTADGIISGEAGKEFWQIARDEMSRNCFSRGRKMYEAVIKSALDSSVGGRIFVIMDGYPSDERSAAWLTQKLDKKRLTLNIISASDLPVKRAKRRTFTPLDLSMSAVVDGTPGHVIKSKKANFPTAMKFIDGHNRDESITILKFRAMDSQNFTAYVDGNTDNLTIAVLTYKKIELTITDPSGRKNSPEQKSLFESASTPEGISAFRFDRLNSVRISQPAKGQWIIGIEVPSPSNDPYVVKIAATGIPDVKFRILQMHNSSSHPGLQDTGITQRPIVGQPVTVVVQLRKKINPVFLEFRDIDSTVLERQSVFPTKLPNLYFANMIIPKKSFFIRLFGFDDQGKRLSRTKPQMITPATVYVSATRHTDSVKKPTKGKPYGMNFSVQNQAETGYFTIQAFDSQGWIKDFQPKSMLIPNGEVGEGSVLLIIPNNTMVGSSTEIGIAATGVSKKDSCKVDINQYHEHLVVEEQ